jgi:hypothetical protein
MGVRSTKVEARVEERVEGTKAKVKRHFGGI